MSFHNQRVEEQIIYLIEADNEKLTNIYDLLPTVIFLLSFYYLV